MLAGDSSFPEQNRYENNTIANYFEYFYFRVILKKTTIAEPVAYENRVKDIGGVGNLEY